MTDNNNGGGNGLDHFIIEISKEEFESKLDESITNAVLDYNELSKLEKKYEKDLMKYELKYFRDGYELYYIKVSDKDDKTR